jgi:hypothetical protein
MSESGCPMPIGEVITTLSEIYRHQGRPEVVELLDNAHARFDLINYDNWNGGTNTWALCLDVPVPIFTSFEPRLSEIECEIRVKLAPIQRNHPNDPIEEVRITPIPSGSQLLATRVAPSELDARRIWLDGCFRLFLSHLSSDKIAVSKLSDELRIYGISAFVAHEHIQPSLPWQDEIILGLRTMHALVALVTPEFHKSQWTDQEIGWALGRGVPVISIRLGKDPCGFAGKFQALSGSLEQPTALSKSIVAVLITNPLTSSEMRRAVVKAFSSSRSFVRSIALKAVIVKATGFSDEEKTELQKACTENPFVSGAYFVPEAIYKITGHPVGPVVDPSVEADVPF